MSVSERFREAAMKVLEGDDSIASVQALEGVLIEEYLGDPRTEDLLMLLSLYSPGAGTPYSDAGEVRRSIVEALTELA